MPRFDAPPVSATTLIAAGLRPRTAKAPREDLVEDLARYLAPKAFEDRRRSPKCRETALTNQRRARALAKLVLRYPRIAKALASQPQEEAAA